MSPDVLNDLKRCKADAMRGQDAGRQLIYTRAIDEIERLRALLKDIVAYWPATTSALCERARAEVAKADADGQSGDTK